jgi:hypothetical protein
VYQGCSKLYLAFSTPDNLLSSYTHSDIPTKVYILHLNSQRAANDKIVIRELDDTNLLIYAKVGKFHMLEHSTMSALKELRVRYCASTSCTLSD